MIFATGDFLLYLLRRGRYARYAPQSEMGAAFMGDLPSAAVELLQPGDALFTSQYGSIIAWSIMYLTSSEVNHVAIYLGQGQIAHATLGGLVVDRIEALYGAEVRLLPVRVDENEERRREIVQRTTPTSPRCSAASSARRRARCGEAAPPWCQDRVAPESCAPPPWRGLGSSPTMPALTQCPGVIAMRNALTRIALLALSFACSAPGSVAAAGSPLIPREVLFAPPVRRHPVLSPDGTRLAWVERAPWGELRPRVVTIGRRDTVSFLEEPDAVDFVEWAGDGRRLLYLRQRQGDENWHLWALDTRTRRSRDLTPFEGARAEEFFVDPRHPEDVIVGLNRRDPRVFDLWRVNLRTGEARLDTRNPGDVVSWAVDPDFQVRAAVALDPRTSDTILRWRARGDTTWCRHQVWEFAHAGMDRDRRILGFRQDGNAIYVQNSIGTNTSRVLETELGGSHERQVVPPHPRADLWNQDAFAGSEGRCVVLLHPRTRRPQAAAANFLKPEWFAVDSTLAPDLRLLAARHGGVFDVVSRDTLDRRWIVRWERDTASGVYELYDRRARRLTPLFESNPALGRLPLSPMQTVTAVAADGLAIPCYLTLPRDLPARRLPLVVMPHGGPWYRDEWGYSPDAQWLANRGYAVLQPQFRGSTGFGLAWLNAGDGQFGPGKVLGDIRDAALWLARQGIADSTRIGIVGGSFGGYAALCALAFASDVFRCGIDLVGPSDLAHLITTFPPYWEARRRRWLNRMGDVLADSALNRRLSPLYHVDAIRSPLLVVHGVHDPRVKLPPISPRPPPVRALGWHAILAAVARSRVPGDPGRPDRGLRSEGDVEVDGSIPFSSTIFRLSVSSCCGV